MRDGHYRRYYDQWAYMFPLLLPCWTSEMAGIMLLAIVLRVYKPPFYHKNIYA